MAKLVAAGVTLRNQVNRRYPRRSKRSDGWIGDKAHQARVSDHNPDRNGWVHAIDIDKHMGPVGKWRNGLAARKLANQLRLYAASGLPGSERVKYIVFEGKLASGTHKNSWWKWRPGQWGHYQHIHVSFTAAAQNDGQIFPLPILTKDKARKQEWWGQLRGNK